jgi:hypothetical protein
MAKINPEELCPCGSGLLFKNCHGPRVKKPEVPVITQRMSLKVIPEPDHNTRAVFMLNNDGDGTIIFAGYDVGLALTCGSCASELVVGMKRESITGIVIQCKKCGSFNDT